MVVQRLAYSVHQCQFVNIYKDNKLYMEIGKLILESTIHCNTIDPHCKRTFEWCQMYTCNTGHHSSTNIRAKVQTGVFLLKGSSS